MSASSSPSFPRKREPIATDRAIMRLPADMGPRLRGDDGHQWVGQE